MNVFLLILISAAAGAIAFVLYANHKLQQTTMRLIETESDASESSGYPNPPGP